MSGLKYFGVGKLIVGILIGAIIFGGSAIAYNNYVSDNTPSGGYLLCANKKSGAVTYPNKLVCPSGTVALDMGAVAGTEGPQGPEGPEGPQGAQGPTGPAGTSSGGKVWANVVPSKQDIVADGQINSTSAMVRKILFTLKPTDISGNYFKLRAHIGGLWSDSARVDSLIQCYFQTATEYSGSGNIQWGKDHAEYQSWNVVSLNVFGDWTPSQDGVMYLVCRTSGTVKDLQVMVEATDAIWQGKITNSF